MMRFPPRLKWDLARVRIAQKFSTSPRRQPLLHLDLAEFPSQIEVPAEASADFPAHTETASGAGTDSSSTVSSRDSHVLAFVRENASPVVWIGGDTPLRYPRIGHLAREIIDLGRTVFIETDATFLRRRIHEFRPVSRLYLVLPLNGLETAHDQLAQQPGNFRATIESIRTAKLSGFHICAQTTIFADNQPNDLRELAAFIQKLDIDGWIQARPPVSSAAQPTEEKLTSARKLIPNPNWKTFSELLPLRKKVRGVSTLGGTLPRSATHAEFACEANLGLWVAPSGATLPSQEKGASAPEGRANIKGKVGGVSNGSSNQSPTQEESIRAV